MPGSTAGETPAATALNSALKNAGRSSGGTPQGGQFEYNNNNNAALNLFLLNVGNERAGASSITFGYGNNDSGSRGIARSIRRLNRDGIRPAGAARVARGCEIQG